MPKFNPGDLVRAVDPAFTLLARGDHPGRKVGDVLIVRARPASTFAAGGSVFFDQAPGAHAHAPGGLTWCPESYFELIARAGEPVTYQPGDVVECVRDFTSDGGFTPGKRYTVGAAYAPSKATVEDDLGRHRFCGRAALNVYNSIKLVHRPDPVKADTGRQPLVYTYAGVGPIREGDELELTVRGQFRMVANEGCVELPAQEGDLGRLRSQFVNLARAQTVKPIEKPLAVGDQARVVGGHISGEIVAIHGEHAMLNYALARYHVYRLANLERIQ